MRFFRMLRLSHLRQPMVFCALVICQGCSSVAPWERGTLAKPEMSIMPDPALTGLRDHIFSSKEGSQGGHSGTGGGCGCN